MESTLRARRVAAVAPESEPAAEAYNKLLTDIQATVLGMFPGLVCRGVDRLASSSALEFDSQLADVDISELCSALKRHYNVQARCQVRSRDHATVLIVCVPLAKNIKWGCCERLSNQQLMLIVQSVILSLLLLCGVGYFAGQLLLHDDSST